MFLKKEIHIRFLEVLLPVLTIIFFIDTFFGEWSKYPEWLDLGGDPNLFPRLVLLILMVSTMLFLFKKEEQPLYLQIREVFFFLLFILSTLELIFLVRYIGLIVVTLVYISLWLFYLSSRNISFYKCIAIAIGCAICALLISRITNVYLPEALLF